MSEPIRVPPPSGPRPIVVDPPPCTHAWYAAGLVTRYGSSRAVIREEDAIVVLYCTRCAEVRSKPVRPERRER